MQLHGNKAGWAINANRFHEKGPPILPDNSPEAFNGFSQVSMEAL